MARLDYLPAVMRVERPAGSDLSFVELGGEIDLRVHGELRDLLWLEIDAGRHLVVDLRRVEFLDSTALGLLVGALKRGRERPSHGAAPTSLVLIVDGGDVERTIDLTGLRRLFRIAVTREDAECMI